MWLISNQRHAISHDIHDYSRNGHLWYKKMIMIYISFKLMKLQWHEIEIIIFNQQALMENFERLQTTLMQKNIPLTNQSCVVLSLPVD